MDYDYSKLFGRLRELHKTQEEWAEYINVTPATLNFKLHNKTSFRQPEIFKSCEFLNIPVIEIPEYFFAHKL